jgi:hypothetical protein
MRRYAQLTVRFRGNEQRLLVSEGENILAVVNGELLLAPAEGDYREARECERARQAILHQCGGEMPRGLTQDSVLAIKQACGHAMRRARKVRRTRRRA